MVPRSPPAVHSSAWSAFETNLDSMMHLVTLSARELTLSNQAMRRVSRALTGPLDLTNEKKLIALLNAQTRTMSKVQANLDRYSTAALWQVVLLVTLVEAYLQDQLMAAAAVDAELMSKSEQAALYADIVSAPSLEELVAQMRRKWANGWLRDGGPTRWIARLEKMGARGFPKGLAGRLELIWGIRHVAVHSAGIATADFVKRHPGATKGVGVRLNVGQRQFQAYFSAASEFLKATERFFVSRYPSLKVSDAVKHPK